MSARDTPPITVSRFGNHVVKWPAQRLRDVLGQLQRERHSITGAGATKLLTEAEHIKLAATQHILTTNGPGQ